MILIFECWMICFVVFVDMLKIMLWMSQKNHSATEIISTALHTLTDILLTDFEWQIFSKRFAWLDSWLT